MENWTINGEAYRYNAKGADPWIAISNDTRIGYDLDFTKIYFYLIKTLTLQE